MSGAYSPSHPFVSSFMSCHVMSCQQSNPITKSPGPFHSIFCPQCRTSCIKSIHPIKIYITVVHNTLNTWVMLRRKMCSLFSLGGWEGDFLESSLSSSLRPSRHIAAQGRGYGIRTVRLFLSDVRPAPFERTASPRDLPPKPQLVTSKAWWSPVQIFFEYTAASLGFRLFIPF